MKERFLKDFEKSKPFLLGKNTSWLPKMRESAFHHFSKMELPQKKEEDWKYSSLSSWLEFPYIFSPLSNENVSSSPEYLSLLKPSCLLFFQNGRLEKSSSNLKFFSSKSGIGNLQEALDQNPSFFQTSLKENSFPPKDMFSFLNTAFFTDGSWVDLPPGKIMEEPIFLFYGASPKVSAETFFYRNILRLNEGSKAVIFQIHQGDSPLEYSTNNINQIFLGRNAHLHLIHLQKESEKAIHFSHSIVQQDQGSSIRFSSFTLGSLLSKNKIMIRQQNPLAESHLLGLYLGKNSQEIEHQTLIDHQFSQGTSREIFKGILSDQSRASFIGKILVRKEAQNTDAKQLNRNLLLSSQAKIDSTPQLEIAADQVKCNHGCTTSGFGKEELFYLRSRGISLEESKKILIKGFGQEILNDIPVSELKNYLENQVGNYFSL